MTDRRQNGIIELSFGTVVFHLIELFWQSQLCIPMQVPVFLVCRHFLPNRGIILSEFGRKARITEKLKKFQIFCQIFIRNGRGRSSVEIHQWLCHTNEQKQKKTKTLFVSWMLKFLSIKLSYFNENSWNIQCNCSSEFLSGSFLWRFSW